MNRFLAALTFTSLILTSCKPKEADYSSLKYQSSGNLFIDPDTSKPFTGIAKDAYPNGKPKAEYPMKNGLMEGTVREWWPNGQHLAVTEFKKGQHSGKNTEWTQNGDLFRERVYDKDHIVSEKTYGIGKP
jgi:antitoxin component YwqK of YwqJK toxin-antitoxin module